MLEEETVVTKGAGDDSRVHVNVSNMLHCAALRESSGVIRNISCPNLEEHFIRNVDILCHLFIPPSLLSLGVFFTGIRPSACNRRVRNKPHVEGEVGVVNSVAILVKRTKLGKSHRLGRAGHI